LLEPTIFTTIYFYPEDVPTKHLYPPIKLHSDMNRRMSLAFTSMKTTNHTPVPGGYKYEHLALQVGGVSDETVKYGREFCGASTQE
jgi:hypothetical protein